MTAVRKTWGWTRLVGGLKGETRENRWMWGTGAGPCEPGFVCSMSKEFRRFCDTAESLVAENFAAAWRAGRPPADAGARGSNHRHADFQSAALPTELPGLIGRQLYRGATGGLSRRATARSPGCKRPSARDLQAISPATAVRPCRERRGRRQPVSAASDRPGAPACRCSRSPPSARAPGARPRAAAPRGSPASARRWRSAPAPARERPP